MSLFGAIGAIGSLIGGIGALIGSTKKPKAPSISQSIPSEVLSIIQSKLSPLSDQARQIALQYLQYYAQGKLPPHLQTQLDAQYRTLLDRFNQALAIRGISPNSTIAIKGMQQLKDWYNNAYSGLFSQMLGDITSLTGLGEEDIRMMLGSYGVGVQALQAGTQAGLMRGGVLGSAISQIGSGLGSLVSEVGNRGQLNFPESTPSFKLPEPQLDLSFWRR
jgi:hypothetical protein